MVSGEVDLAFRIKVKDNSQFISTIDNFLKAIRELADSNNIEVVGSP